MTIPKRGGEEGFGQRRLHLPAVGERREEPLGLGLVSRREAQREALQGWRPPGAAIADQHRRAADAETPGITMSSVLG